MLPLAGIATESPIEALHKARRRWSVLSMAQAKRARLDIRLG